MKPAGMPSNGEEARVEAVLARAAMFEGLAPRYGPALAGAASPSYHGVESSSYLVASEEAAEPRYFVKLTEGSLLPHVDLVASFEAAAVIAGLGLAPAPLLLDEAQGAIVFDRLGPEWKPATIDVLARPERLETVLSAFRQIAAGPPLRRGWTVFSGIAGLRALLGEDAGTLPPDAWWMLEEVDAIGEAMTAAGLDSRPAHGDPHASNLLFAPDGRLRLVDFDMAANIDPHYQLAALFNEACEFDAEMKRGVEMAEGSFREDVFHRCLAYGAADDLYWALRALVMDRLSPRLGVEFRKYAGWRFLRCRMRLGRPGFEHALRRM